MRTNFVNMDIVSSYLRLNVSSMLAIPTSAGINRIVMDWTETSTTLFSSLGSTDINVDISNPSVLNIPTSSTGYQSSDVTNIVNEWSLGTSNFGFRVKATSDDIDFFSSDSATSNEWPELEVNYNSYILDGSTN